MVVIQTISSLYLNVCHLPLEREVNHKQNMFHLNFVFQINYNQHLFFLAQILIAFNLNSVLVPTFQSYYLLANFKLNLKTNIFIEWHIKRTHFGSKDADYIKAKEEVKEGIWGCSHRYFPQARHTTAPSPRRVAHMIHEKWRCTVVCLWSPTESLLWED